MSLSFVLPRVIKKKKPDRDGKTHMSSYLSGVFPGRLEFARHRQLFIAATFKTLLELVHTTTGIYILLLAGEERMALGANVHAQFTVSITLGRASSNRFTTGAADSYFFIFGMDSCFHCFHLIPQIFTANSIPQSGRKCNSFRENFPVRCRFFSIFSRLSYHTLDSISFLSLPMIFFSSREMYDCDIPSTSATSFCVISRLPERP